MDKTHPAAVGHLPPFITGPGQTDVLFIATVILLIGILLAVGNLYLRLHALPEQMAHRANKVQFEIVAVLALIALFTHNHLYWIAALLLAFVQLPDFSSPIASMAKSLEKLAHRDDRIRRAAQREVPEAMAAFQEMSTHREGSREEELKVVADPKPLTDKVKARG
jgi:predicted MFS family arabinose efflux permease